jgi:hypothetical protein
VHFAGLKRCVELRDEHIVRAIASSEAMKALLDRFAEIARPGTGAPVVLAALARMGTSTCHWIEGELRVELSGDASHTTIAVSTTLGAGFWEKPFHDTILRVPVDEFLRGVTRAPRIIEPLEVHELSERLVLSVSQEVRKTSLPPPMVEVDPQSFVAVPPMPVPQGMGNAEATPAPASPPKIVLRKRVRGDAPPR